MRFLKVDNEVQTLGAGKTAKNADVIAENLRQIVQDEPSVQGTYVQKLINAIKQVQMMLSTARLKVTSKLKRICYKQIYSRRNGISIWRCI